MLIFSISTDYIPIKYFFRIKSKHTICVRTTGEYQGINTPIFTSTSNKYIGYDDQAYPRYFNTHNQKVIAEILCELEHAEAGLVFSSGMAAISTALFSVLKSGVHVLFTGNLYGGTQRFLIDEFEKFNIEYDILGEDIETEFKLKMIPNTKMVYTETPSNPLHLNIFI